MVISYEIYESQKFEDSVYHNPSLAEHDMPVLANSVDPHQLASEEAN